MKNISGIRITRNPFLFSVLLALVLALQTEVPANDVPTLYPESQWRLGWPPGKVYAGIPEINGLYHATNVTMLPDGRLQFYYEFDEERELLDFLEWDGSGIKGYAVISGGKLTLNGRTEADTSFRSGIYLNAMFIGADCEIEYQSYNPNGGGNDLAFMLSEPGREINGRPTDFYLAKFKYFDQSSFWIQIGGGDGYAKAKLQKRYSNWEGQYRRTEEWGYWGSNRHVKWIWKDDTMSLIINDHLVRDPDHRPDLPGDQQDINPNVSRSELEGWPRPGRGICMGITAGNIGQPIQYSWLKITGRLDPRELAKAQQYGLVPIVNGARWGEDGYPQSGDPRFYSNLSAVGSVNMWTWLKLNLTNYRYHSYGRSVSDYEEPLPVADAGLDKSPLYGEIIYELDSVTLDGNGSYDPIYYNVDLSPLDPWPYNNPSAYSWTQVSGPSVSLQGADTNAPSFTVPAVSETTTLKFQLTVTGTYGTSAPDYVEVTVNDSPGYNISGMVTFEYPGWSQTTAPVMYQVRSPGLPPTNPYYDGLLTVTMSTGNPAVGSFTISDIPDGTFAVALKHYNHIADLETNVTLSGTDVTGLDLTLWAGDADGDDDSATVYPADPEGDNDVDFYDYYTLYYQYLGSLSVTTGRNADFDGDGDADPVQPIDFYDYYGLYYGYLQNSDPANWYY